MSSLLLLLHKLTIHFPHTFAPCNCINQHILNKIMMTEVIGQEANVIALLLIELVALTV